MRLGRRKGAGTRILRKAARIRLQRICAGIPSSRGRPSTRFITAHNGSSLFARPCRCRRAAARALQRRATQGLSAAERETRGAARLTSQRRQRGRRHGTLGRARTPRWGQLRGPLPSIRTRPRSRTAGQRQGSALMARPASLSPRTPANLVEPALSLSLSLRLPQSDPPDGAASRRRISAAIWPLKPRSSTPGAALRVTPARTPSESTAPSRGAGRVAAVRGSGVRPVPASRRAT